MERIVVYRGNRIEIREPAESYSLENALRLFKNVLADGKRAAKKARAFQSVREVTRLKESSRIRRATKNRRGGDPLTAGSTYHRQPLTRRT